MKRSRGDKTSKAERAVRRAKALELMKQGRKQTEIQDALGVSRATFWRDLQALEAQYVDGSKDDVKQFKEAQYRALMKIEEATANGTIEPDVANALTRVRDSVAKLLGLNAESRHLHAHVNANPEHSREYLLFRESVAGLNEEQLHEVYAFAKKLPRAPVVTVRDASWFPPPMRQLEDGGE